MLKKILLITFTFAFLILSAQTYKLNYLIEEGLKNSRDINVKKLENQNSRSQFNSAVNDFILPNAMYNYNFDTNSDKYSSSVSVSKTLSSNESTVFNLWQSSLDKKSSKLELKSNIQNFAYSVLSAYLSIVETQKNIEILKENLTLQKRTYEQVLIQYNNNKKTIYDLQSSQIDTLSAYTDLLELQTQLTKQREDLFNLINIEDQNYPLEDLELSINNDYKYSDNYEIEIAKLNNEKMNISLTQSKLTLYPVLSLSASIGVTNIDNSADVILKTNGFTNNNSFSLNLSYPLFSWYEDGLNYRMKKRSLKINDLTLENLKTNNQSKYKQAINDLKIYQKTYEINKQKVELAKTNLQIAEQRFNLGIINLLDLDKSRIQYLQSQLTLNSKYYSLLKKQEEINMLTNGKVLNQW